MAAPAPPLGLVVRQALAPTVVESAREELELLASLEYEPDSDAVHALTVGSYWFDLSRPPTNRIEATALQLSKHSALRTMADGAEVIGVEWWWQEQDDDELPKELHTDKCAARVTDDIGEERIVSAHPLVASVLYLGSAGGPTVVFEQTLDAERAAGTGALPPAPARALVCPPERGRWLLFRGDLLHGVMAPARAPEPAAAAALSRADGGAGLGADGGAAGSGDSHRTSTRWTRQTLLFNWWTRPPPGATHPPARYATAAARELGGDSAVRDGEGGVALGGQVSETQPAVCVTVSRTGRCELCAAPPGRAAPTCASASPALAPLAFAAHALQHWAQGQIPPALHAALGREGVPRGAPALLHYGHPAATLDRPPEPPRPSAVHWQGLWAAAESGSRHLSGAGAPAGADDEADSAARADWRHGDASPRGCTTTPRVDNERTAAEVTPAEQHGDDLGASIGSALAALRSGWPSPA